MSKCESGDGLVEVSSRRLLLGLYQAARFLSLLSSSLDREEAPLQLKAPRKQRNRWLIFIWRVILVGIYWSVIPGILGQVRSTKSYADLFVMLQSNSVTLFAVGSFIMQVCADAKFRNVLNRYIALYGRICELTKAENLFSGKFPLLYTLKLLLTLCGCLFELTQLLPLHYILELDYGHIISGLIAIYLWLGTLFLLDCCFLGFLGSGVLYEHMGNHISDMLQQMRSIDVDYQKDSSEEEAEVKNPATENPHLSNFKRMCLLCDRADELENCGVVYTELYRVTLMFRDIFQWQIIFYIYYNLIVLLIMLYEYILGYLEGTENDYVPVVMMLIKMSNIVLLIMCADYMIKKSRMPQILPLDIVCTDIDQRWDQAVEYFLNQLQAQQVEVKVIGLVQINNGLIPTILSAIVTYLFILIQFAFTGGFDESKEITQLNLTM